MAPTLGSGPSCCRASVAEPASARTCVVEEQQEDDEVHDHADDGVDRQPLLPLPAVSRQLLRHVLLLPIALRPSRRCTGGMCLRIRRIAESSLRMARRLLVGPDARSGGTACPGSSPTAAGRSPAGRTGRAPTKRSRRASGLNATAGT